MIKRKKVTTKRATDGMFWLWFLDLVSISVGKYTRSDYIDSFFWGD